MADESSPEKDRVGLPPTTTVGAPPAPQQTTPLAERAAPSETTPPPPPPLAPEARQRFGSEARESKAAELLVADLDEGARFFKDPTRELSPVVESLLSFEAALV